MKYDGVGYGMMGVGFGARESGSFRLRLRCDGLREIGCRRYGIRYGLTGDDIKTWAARGDYDRVRR